jgi:hypothetical protein
MHACRNPWSQPGAWALLTLPCGSRPDLGSLATVALPLGWGVPAAFLAAAVARRGTNPTGLWPLGFAFPPIGATSATSATSPDSRCSEHVSGVAFA